MDFAVGLPTTSRGNDMFCLVICRHSKMVTLIALNQNMTAPEIMDRLTTEVFCKYGFPTSIVSDRDSKFTSGFWEEYCRRAGIALNMSTAGHPATDGQSERAIRDTKQTVRTTLAPDFSDWDLKLPFIAFALNSHVSSTTKFSPHQVVLGYQPSMKLLNRQPSDQNVPSIEDRILHQENVWKAVGDHIHRAQEAQRHQANKKRRYVSFEDGDWILVDAGKVGLWPTVAGTPGSLQNSWVGPFQVRRVISETVVDVDFPPQFNRMHSKIHVDKVKQFIWNDEERFPGRMVQPPEPVVISGHEEWHVEKILDEKLIGRGSSRRPHYLVQWKDRPMERLKWLPRENLETEDGVCQALLDWESNPPPRPNTRAHSKRGEV